MTGHAVRGHMGFVPKDGENFDARLNVRFHSEQLEQAARFKLPDESLADYIRVALRERLLRDARKQQ